MENASQALIIAGAILLAILIIAIGMYIYNSASSTIQSSMESMNSSEIEAFNAKFEKYIGIQKGTQISALVSSLISNASVNFEERTMVPDVKASSTTFSSDYNISFAGNEVYMENLSKLKNDISNIHNYKVKIEYNDKGLVSIIIISDKNTNDDGN